MPIVEGVFRGKDGSTKTRAIQDPPQPYFYEARRTSPSIETYNPGDVLSINAQETYEKIIYKLVHTTKSPYELKTLAFYEEEGTPPDKSFTFNQMGIPTPPINTTYQPAYDQAKYEAIKQQMMQQQAEIQKYYEGDQLSPLQKKQQEMNEQTLKQMAADQSKASMSEYLSKLYDAMKPKIAEAISSQATGSFYEQWKKQQGKNVTISHSTQYIPDDLFKNSEYFSNKTAKPVPQPPAKPVVKVEPVKPKIPEPVVKKKRFMQTEEEE